MPNRGIECGTVNGRGVSLHKEQLQELQRQEQQQQQQQQQN
jgi:hypothetical protein